MLGRPLVDALGGLTEFGSRAARASLRRDAILCAYRKRGHLVDSMEDIHRLELRDIDAVMPRLDLAYIVVTVAEGRQQVSRSRAAR